MENLIEIKSNRGNGLRGVLHLPPGNCAKVPGIVMCHGFMGTKIGLHRLFVKAARYFSHAGYAVLRFDYSGCGDSDGEHATITIEQQIKETEAAINFLAQNPEVDADQIFLLGLSLGGCVTALTIPQSVSLAGKVLWAPVARPFKDIQGIISREFVLEVKGKGIGNFQGHAIGRNFLESLAKHDPLAVLGKFPEPVLLLHGTGDNEITHQNTYDYALIRSRAGLDNKTSTDFIKGADHTFTSFAWEEELFQKSLCWLQMVIAKKKAYAIVCRSSNRSKRIVTV